MNYYPTTDDFKLINQKEKELGVCIEILNNNFQVIDVMNRELVNGSLAISVSNSNRRSCELTFIAKNKSYLVNKTSKIWFDKYLRLYLTIKGIRDKTIHKYPIGLFMFYQNTFEYNATTNTIKCSCHDLMDKLDGIRNGQLFGAPTTTIPAGTNIREAMIGIISQLGNITKYIIGNVGSRVDSTANTVPYDLKFTTKDNLYTMLNKLINLYSGWEMFFNDNTFIVQEIPTCENDSVVLDSDTIEKYQLVLSEERNNTFENVKNVVEVWGKQINADHYTETCTTSGAQYNATFNTVTELESDRIYAVKLPSANLANATLKINSLTVYPITDSDGTALSVGSINGYSAFKFHNSKFMYLGDYQVHAIAFLVSALPSVAQQNTYKTKFNCNNIQFVVNSESPFTIENIGKDTSNPYEYGLLFVSKSGENFDSIYAQDLALERAVNELELASNFKDTINLECQLIPWLDVNQKFEFKDLISDKIEQWIIQQIDITLLDGKMKIQAKRFYPTIY